MFTFRKYSWANSKSYIKILFSECGFKILLYFIPTFPYFFQKALSSGFTRSSLTSLTSWPWKLKLNKSGTKYKSSSNCMKYNRLITIYDYVILCWLQQQWISTFPRNVFACEIFDSLSCLHLIKSLDSLSIHIILINYKYNVNKYSLFVLFRTPVTKG